PRPPALAEDRSRPEWPGVPEAVRDRRQAEAPGGHPRRPRRPLHRAPGTGARGPARGDDRPGPRGGIGAAPHRVAAHPQPQLDGGSLGHALPAQAAAGHRDRPDRPDLESLDREDARALSLRHRRVGAPPVRAGHARSPHDVDAARARRAQARRGREGRLHERRDAPRRQVTAVIGNNPFETATAASLVDAVATRFPTREAIVFADERVTFADLSDRSQRLARGLAAIGIRAGDKVGIWLPNRPAWFVAQLACARLGAVVVALSPRYRGHELTYILGQSAARAVLLTDQLGGVDYFETLADVLPALAQAIPGEIENARFPNLRHVIVDADDEYPGCIRLRDVFDAGNEADADRAPAPNADDVFTLLYTSGTTSFPKG